MTIYTHNASERMAEQNISPADVERVIEASPGEAIATGSSASIHTGDVDGRQLSVVVEGDPAATQTVLTLWETGA